MRWGVPLTAIRSFTFIFTVALIQHVSLVIAGQSFLAHFSLYTECCNSPKSKVACVFVQKLSQFSCSDQTADDATPWMWTVLDHCTASQHQSLDPDLSMISAEARVAAFFRLLTSLPPAAIVTCQRSPTVKVQGLVQLHHAVNDLARNMIDVRILPADLTLHLVLILASLPAEVNDELTRFLSDCPLITLSAMHHVTTATSAANLARCANAVTDMLGTISSALDEATMLLGGGSPPCPSSLPVWLRSAALWSRLYNSRYTVDASRLRTDSETAESLLLWLTLDMAAGLLRGDNSWQMVEDATMAVWQHHVDALHSLSDCDNEHSPVISVFRHCVSDVVQSLQPLACLRLFVRAANSGLNSFHSRWNVTRTLRWYIRCVQMFDSGQCAVTSLMTLLQQASDAICCFVARMPQSQLLHVDKAILDALDPHIRIVFQQLHNLEI